jgi:uncharacterized protein YdhG (YjbR/CyaY superfamily)
MKKNTTATKRQPMRSPVSSVDEYLNRLPDDQAEALAKLREAIKAAAPKVEEVISYMIPTYKYKGALVHFAAFKNHCSYFVINKSILKKFENELKPFKVSGTSIHFTPNNLIPSSLVKKIVKIRMQENEERDLAKALAKKTK